VDWGKSGSSFPKVFAINFVFFLVGDFSHFKPIKSRERGPEIRMRDTLEDTSITEG
jgi:hypothetical protein